MRYIHTNYSEIPELESESNEEEEGQFIFHYN